eukprot:Gregarina_sp_Pseudo_9__5408@NODE_664_length_2403_cov_21_026650_g627_i0_p1_GENE_NODE_664_length_2403_cov_21_026650_g627_i0NODE_664_length_2403_cov_21_026650_g627_i0_p1_ORF_typecomplete_len547_score133_23Metallophos/PF00149_28/9_5e34PPP5/PF08321_12/5_3e14TPR_16/PF13432_6/0_00086TPR_16/PF13432_6/0_00062TPR_11/PF13414_6/0_0011TPR_11/PF13414_6/8_1TPR_11/PF13414_6/1_8TPR_11/PF13414_6/2_3e03TPR_2/PF07719_17/0_4TPR_2/PF07719_17/0_0051TPR_2/PF07719_17/5_1e03TPR_9/PF13371_6/4e02TPR_9/PF13371_6/4_2e05TPR_1
MGTSTHVKFSRRSSGQGYAMSVGTVTTTTTTAAESSQPGCSSPLVSADSLRLEGNEFFKAGRFSEAVVRYDAAIKLLETPFVGPSHDQAASEETRVKQLSMLLCNRSLCQLKLEALGLAVADAARAIELSQNKSAKAFFRRGTAQLALLKYDLAVKDFRAAQKLAPTDPDARRRLDEATKLHKEQKFAEAIRGEEEKLVSESIDMEMWPVPANYKGPLYLGPEHRTPETFRSLLDFYKANPENKIPKRSMLQLALDVIESYASEPNVIDIDVANEVQHTITVCGDVHGQFYDLYNIFEMNGMPSSTNKYLFNGDFVDRGSFSVEVITALYLAKLVWPDGLYLTRGNHESRRMTKLYGFEGEMRHKGAPTIYDVYCESFDSLPLAHTINGRVFVVHGGLSIRPGVTVEEINKISRRTDEDGELMSDLLWADPQPEPGSAPSKRGVSNTFGPNITKNFLDTNNFELIIRSHEMKDEGYEIEHGGKLITVFSAPNYCDQIKNKGAYLKFTGKQLHAKGKLELPTTHVFEDVPHPPVRAMAYANKLLGLF